MIRLKTKVLWRMISLCLMWVVWRERNTYTFEGNERSIHELKLLFFQTLLDCAKSSGVFTFISLPDMLDLCTFFVALLPLAHCLCAFFLFIFLHFFR